MMWGAGLPKAASSSVKIIFNHAAFPNINLKRITLKLKKRSNKNVCELSLITFGMDLVESMQAVFIKLMNFLI